MDRELQMVWMLEEWPEPAALVAFVEALMPTMPEPLNRVTAWGTPTQTTRRKWDPANAAELLRDGYRGNPIEYFDVSRHRFGKNVDNRHPNGSVECSIDLSAVDHENHEQRPSEVVIIARRLVTTDETDADAAAIALEWSDAAQRLFAPKNGMAVLDITRNATLFYVQGHVNGSTEDALEGLRPHVDDPEAYLQTLYVLGRSTGDDAYRDVRLGTRIRSVRLVQVLMPRLAAFIRGRLEPRFGRVPGTMVDLGDRVVWTVTDEAEQRAAHDELVKFWKCVEPVWLPLVGEQGEEWTGG